MIMLSLDSLSFKHGYWSSDFVITVPNLEVSDEDYLEKKKEGRKEGRKEAFYIPATHECSYDDFKRAIGNVDDWTMVNKEERKKIKWEHRREGRWIWVEASDPCPRQEMSFDAMCESIKLLSLEEYVIVCAFHFRQTGQLLDQRAWTFLSTLWDAGCVEQGVLFAMGLNIYRAEPEFRRSTITFQGGRAYEEVEKEEITLILA